MKIFNGRDINMSGFFREILTRGVCSTRNQVLVKHKRLRIFIIMSNSWSILYNYTCFMNKTDINTIHANEIPNVYNDCQ